MSVPRVHAVVFDCPDPIALGEFYARLLEWTIHTDQYNDGYADGGWVSIVGDHGMRLDFQRVENYRQPTWPTSELPQQLHLDFNVDDPDAAHERAIGLGATLLDTQKSFRVYADPAGHPFCLCG
ncbi:VOC family protein [Actinophytocola sediminis]